MPLRGEWGPDPIHDPKYRGPLGVYANPEDPRVIVPKRDLPGGTVNFAHPVKGFVAIVLAVALAAGPTVALVLSGRGTVAGVLATEAASILALILIARRMARWPPG